MRRNAPRKQRFLDQISSSPKLSEVFFLCELCDFQTNCKYSLRKQIEKEHNIIPQMYGYEESFEQEPNHLMKVMIVSSSNKCD